MTPWEYLRETAQRRLQTEQRHSEQQFELVTDVVAAFEAMHAAEQALYQARRHYIESFKRATWEHGKPRNYGRQDFQHRRFRFSSGGWIFATSCHRRLRQTLKHRMKTVWGTEADIR